MEEVKHRINKTTIAGIQSPLVSITQRAFMDETRSHTVFLTRNELVALLAAMDGAA
jgi:hypothetical protein